MELIWIAFGLLVGIIQTRRYYKTRLINAQNTIEQLKHEIATLEVYTVTTLNSDDELAWDSDLLNVR